MKNSNKQSVWQILLCPARPAAGACGVTVTVSRGLGPFSGLTKLDYVLFLVIIINILSAKASLAQSRPLLSPARGDVGLIDTDTLLEEWKRGGVHVWIGFR